MAEVVSTVDHAAYVRKFRYWGGSGWKDLRRIDYDDVGNNRCRLNVGSVKVL